MDKFEDIVKPLNKKGLLDEVMKRHKELSIERAKKRKQGKDVYHVTDLIYCAKKKRYMKEHPEMGGEVSLVPAVFHGACFERGLQTVIYDWLSKGDAATFWRKGRKEVNGYTVVGEADCIIENEKGRIVIEIKDKVYGVSSSKHYELQTRLYRWLFSTDKALLWIFSNKDKKGYAEYDMSDNFMSNADILTLIETYNKEGEAEPFWPEWECKYCNNKECPKCQG